MPEKAENVKHIYAVIAIIVTVAWYGIERIAEVFVSFNKASAVVLAMLSVVVLVVVFFLIDSCSDSFNGMLASLVAFKMMPPSSGRAGRRFKNPSAKFASIKSSKSAEFIPNTLLTAQHSARTAKLQSGPAADIASCIRGESISGV